MSASEIDRLRDDERALYEAVPADGGRITSRRSRTDFGSLRPYWPDILSGPIFEPTDVSVGRVTGLGVVGRVHRVTASRGRSRLLASGSRTRGG